MNLRWIPFVLCFMIACSESADTKKHRFLLKGNAELNDRHEEAAIRYFTEALKIDSCFADAHNNLGTLYFRQKDFDLAVQHYTSAINCKSDYLPAYFNRSNAYYEWRKPDSALIDIRKVLAAKPDSVPAVFLQGLILTQRKAYPEAEEAFKRVIKLDKSNVEAIINLGIVYYYKDELTLAKYHLLNASGFKPSSIETYNALTLVETAGGQYETALLYSDRALALDKNNSYSLNNKGYVFLMIREPDKALPYIDEAIVADPYNSYAYRNKAIYHLQKQDAPNAIRLLEQAIGIDENTDKVFRYLSEAYYMNKQLDKACEAQAKAIAHHERINNPLPCK